MKKMILIITALSLMLALAGCGCKHETWNEADCVNPKTCAECGETEGSPLGHSWKAATCDAAKTCENCGETEGEALGHAWVASDCETPKTCYNCKLTDGEALGHDWQDATTELPKTCNTCGKTEGEKIVTDPRFTTANNEMLFGKWIAEINEYIPDFDMELAMNVSMEFHNDGSVKLDMELKDPEAFMQLMLEIMVESTYAEMEAQGYGKEDTDEAFLEVYGMDVRAYMESQLTGLDMNDVLGLVDLTYVYYAEGDQLYMGLNWEMISEGQKFELLDGILYVFEGGDEPTAYHKAEE